jgi:hypothetical protein
MTVDPYDRAIDRFRENIGPAAEPVVAVSDTAILVYQRHYRDGGLDVVGIPRARLEEFIAHLVEADRNAGLRPRVYEFWALDEQPE